MKIVFFGGIRNHCSIMCMGSYVTISHSSHTLDGLEHSFVYIGIQAMAFILTLHIIGELVEHNFVLLFAQIDKICACYESQRRSFTGIKSSFRY